MNDDEAFTNYMRAVMESSQAAESAFEGMWKKLHHVLKSELRRSSMRSSSPAYAGLLGYQTWDWRGNYDREATRGPLDELAAIAYLFIFERRWKYFAEKLGGNTEPVENPEEVERQENIDGYVVLCLRDFLRETRKRNDPLGYLVYTSLRRVLRQAVQTGDLHLISGPEKIYSDTFLGTAPAESAAYRANARALDVFVTKWTADLLPELVTARGGARRSVIDKLRGQLSELEPGGVRSFQVGELIARFRYQVRRTWAGILEEEAGEWAMDESQRIHNLVSTFLPQREADEAERLDRLVACVTNLLGQLKVTRPTRGHLDTLWGYLQSQSLEEGPDARAGEAAMPSRRGLAEVLGIPRNRIGELFVTLAQQVERCQCLFSGKVTSIEERSGGRDRPERRHA